MSKNTSIYRFLPNNEYYAAIGANLPSASNVFATISDVTASQLDVENNGNPFEVNVGTLNFTGAGVVLTTTGGANATVTVTIAGGTGAPGGNSGEIQFNNGGAFDADANLFWDIANSRLGIGTNTPDAELHIEGTGIQEAIIKSTDNNASIKLISADANNSYIDFEEASGDRWIMGGVGGSSDSFIWSSGTAFSTSKRFSMVRPGGASTAAPEFRMYEGDPGGGAGNFVGLKAPQTMVNNVTLTLPTELGDVGAVLTQTNATGSTALSNDVHVTGQVVGGTDLTNVFTANTCEIDLDNGMTQLLEGDALTGTGTLTFVNQKEGATYTVIFIQGSGTHDVNISVLSASGDYWLNSGAFDFSTLADDERAILTVTYLNSEWYFAVKELTLVP